MAGQSTKNMVEVSDVRESVVFLRSGSLRTILDVSSVNFELRSEEEQNAILQNFQQFLNSVDFPLQIVVNSRKYDIKEYVQTVQKATQAVENELLKIQAAEYVKFISELSELSNIMSKKFYIIVPFYISEKPAQKGILGGITGIFKTQSGASITPEQFNTYKNQLNQRVEIILDGLLTLGLHATILQEPELKFLFASLYNPGISVEQPPAES